MPRSSSVPHLPQFESRENSELNSLGADVRVAHLRPAATGFAPSITAITFSAASRAIASRVAAVADPTWGSSTVFGQLAQLRRHVGLVLEDVEPGRRQPARAERLDQRMRVDDRAAAGVDEDRAGLHQRERYRVDQVGVSASAARAG